jgi:hypothetical protein
MKETVKENASIKMIRYAKNEKKEKNLSKKSRK